MSKTTEWSMDERLQELRGKLNLKERDNEAFFISCQEKISNNETMIRDMRESVRIQREVLANCLNGDREVIITALHDNINDQLTYQRSTADKCIAEKNQDVFDQVKKLNSLKHSQNVLQDRIDQLELALSNLRRQETQAQANSRKSAVDSDSEQRIRILSTRLDKLGLKINSARYVNTTYKRLRSYLEKDALSLPGRLNELEVLLCQQKVELNELKKIQKEAKNSCDNTRTMRGQMEQTILQEKEVRDKKLAQVRKNLKTLQDEADTFNLNMNRNRLRGDLKQKLSMRESTFTVEKVVRKEALNTALSCLKETVGASKVEDIAENFQRQHDRQNELLTTAENLQKERQALISSVNNAEKQLKVTKMEASIDLQASNDPKQKLQDTDYMTLRNFHEHELEVEHLEVLVARIRRAIGVFYAKTCVLDSDSGCESDMDKMVNKVTHVFVPLSKKTQQMAAEYQTKTEQKVAGLLNSGNVRVELPVDDEEALMSKDGNGGKNNAMLMDDDDLLVEQTYCSRDEIKKRGRQIVDLAKPKKRTGKTKGKK